MAVRNDFTAGEVLAAADLNDTFESKLATTVTTKGDLITRTTSAPSRLAVGTNGQVLTADSAQATGLKWGNGAGMVLITTQTFSAVSSVSLNGCFTSTYENYVIVFFASNASDSDLDFRMRASGSDAAGANYNTLNLLGNGAAASSGVITSGTAGRLSFLRSGSKITAATLNLFRPQIAATTSFFCVSDDGQGIAARLHTGAHVVSTAYDGITLIAVSGSMTGTIRVYGYLNS